jgi:phosphoglycolate phosphatase-like HAD superfamily hydrolase
MNSTPGRALIADFDGTLADLRVDWAALRRRLAVTSIQDLWARGPGAWDEVTAAECAAAMDASLVPGGAELALAAPAVSVLTNNSEMAVRAFLDRHPDLDRRVCAVIGRESLGGPKNDRARFTAGFARGLHAIHERVASTTIDVCYLGDQDYELEFARQLTGAVVDVREVLFFGIAPPHHQEKGDLGP